MSLVCMQEDLIREDKEPFKRSFKVTARDKKSSLGATKAGAQRDARDSSLHTKKKPSLLFCLSIKSR